uniref:C-type lectin domain-containing protein n=1 Tax=Mola mola TaxID=94237 RepID=A0A3Q3WWD6_MOLML
IVVFWAYNNFPVVKVSQLDRDISEVKRRKCRFETGCTKTRHPLNLFQSNVAMLTEGWVSFQSSCYLLSTSTSMWSGAEEACQRLGAHLLVVNSREELVRFSSACLIGLGSHHWIGLVEWHQEGNWTWVDGTDYNLTPKFWAPNQPDNWALRKNGEDCGEIYNNLPLSRQIWNDADCSLKHRYICESR